MKRGLAGGEDVFPRACAPGVVGVCVCARARVVGGQDGACGIDGVMAVGAAGDGDLIAPFHSLSPPRPSPPLSLVCVCVCLWATLI